MIDSFTAAIAVAVFTHNLLTVILTIVNCPKVLGGRRTGHITRTLYTVQCPQLVKTETNMKISMQYADLQTACNRRKKENSNCFLGADFFTHLNICYIDMLREMCRLFEVLCDVIRSFDV